MGTETDIFSRPVSRRTLLRATGASAAAIASWPSLAHAQVLIVPSVIDPYSGSIPLVFPLKRNTYKMPVNNNWHATREGQIYQWNHQDASTTRAHDGVDVYPRSTGALPTVYAPLTAKEAAVCLRSNNTLSGTVTYKVSSTTPPPWNYSQAIDNVANLPLYGNFIWALPRYSSWGPLASGMGMKAGSPSGDNGTHRSTAHSPQSMLETNGMTGAPPAYKEGPQGWIPFSESRAERDIPTGCQVARSSGLQARGVVTALIRAAIATSSSSAICKTRRFCGRSSLTRPSPQPRRLA